MYTQELNELPKNILNKLIDMLIPEIQNSNGFIWVKKCNGHYLEILIEDGNGNCQHRKAKCKEAYVIDEGYVLKRNNIRIYVGNDEDIRCEVNTIWNNNKKRLANPLESLRSKYIPNGKYEGDKNWIKRIDKLEDKAKKLKEGGFIANYKRENSEVIIKCKGLIYIFGVNYGVATSQEGKSPTELFEIVSHKDSISSATNKCLNKYLIPKQIVVLIKEYDLR